MTDAGSGRGPHGVDRAAAGLRAPAEETGGPVSGRRTPTPTGSGSSTGWTAPGSSPRPAGPVVIDRATAAEGPPALDRALTALIIAEAAVDLSLPLRAAAGELLPAYVAEAGPLAPVAEAVARRSGLGPLEAARLPEAAALVEATVRAGGGR